VELGDLQAADEESAVYAQRAEHLKQPFYLWFLTVWKAMRAGMEGRFDEAERLAHPSPDHWPTSAGLRCDPVLYRPDPCLPRRTGTQRY
jgi:hypothetical protein